MKLKESYGFVYGTFDDNCVYKLGIFPKDNSIVNLTFIHKKKHQMMTIQL